MSDDPLAKCEYCGNGPCENCGNTGYKYPVRAELALAAEELAKLPSDAYWIFGKGRTRPDEPLWGLRVFDKSGNVIAEGEAEEADQAIRIALTSSALPF